MMHRATRPLLAALAAAFVAQIGAEIGPPKLFAQAGTPAGRNAPAVTDSLRIYYVGRPVGWERYSLAPISDQRIKYDADLDYIDRGRRTHISAGSMLAADYSPRGLDVVRLTDTSRTIITKLVMSGTRSTMIRDTDTSDVIIRPGTFAISMYTPASQHLALLRFWMGRGSPASLTVVPGGPTREVKIAKRGADTVSVNGTRTILTRYSIDGVVWGIEYAWLDEAGRLALFTSAAGGLSFKAVRGELVPAYDALMEMAARAAITDLATIVARAKAVADGSAAGSVALVGATLIDGTGRAAISDATVIVANGRIVAAGAGASAPVPAGARRIDAKGKTIIPGLWDSHAHINQLEWTPVYLAAGITTVRDMGNEIAYVTALKKFVQSGTSPNLIFAGLVDGPGPNAFGALSAATPAEGRAIVRRYHALGFQQMKLYDLLAPDVVGAICDEAHKLGMVVSGHIPRALTMLAAIDSGMDQVAHMPIRAAPGSDSLNTIIAHLLARHTVMDPMASWNEIGGHSQAEPLQSFQPVTQHVPPVFMQTRAAGWGSATTDTATAHLRLSRTLAIVGALYKAGVPFVVGTDGGVPGFSVYREMELYVKAGMTPMDAIRSATSVPAKAMRMDGDVGTLERGKRADLLVLDANPLDDISNIRTVRLVMKDGKLFESAALWRAVGFTP